MCTELKIGDRIETEWGSPRIVEIQPYSGSLDFIESTLVFDDGRSMSKIKGEKYKRTVTGYSAAIDEIEGCEPLRVGDIIETGWGPATIVTMERMSEKSFYEYDITLDIREHMCKPYGKTYRKLGHDSAYDVYENTVIVLHEITKKGFHFDYADYEMLKVDKSEVKKIRNKLAVFCYSEIFEELDEDTLSDIGGWADLTYRLHAQDTGYPKNFQTIVTLYNLEKNELYKYTLHEILTALSAWIRDARAGLVYVEHNKNNLSKHGIDLVVTYGDSHLGFKQCPIRIETTDIQESPGVWRTLYMLKAPANQDTFFRAYDSVGKCGQALYRAIQVLLRG